jgi:hypothetical protein
MDHAVAAFDRSSDCVDIGHVADRHCFSAKSEWTENSFGLCSISSEGANSMSFGQESLGSVKSHEAGRACDENVHEFNPSNPLPGR